mgnify:CR=1 FL=1
MNVLFLSCGQGLSLASRLAQEGHNVKTFIHNDEANTGAGIYDRISSWKPYVNNSDLVIARRHLRRYWASVSSLQQVIRMLRTKLL